MHHACCLSSLCARSPVLTVLDCTQAFVNELKESGSAGDAAKDIIGQFGVGFYSAFMVGDRVDVISRSAKGGDATLWSSDGSGQFTTQSLTPEQAGLQRGSKIVIHLRQGSHAQRHNRCHA